MSTRTKTYRISLREEVIEQVKLLEKDTNTSFDEVNLGYSWYVYGMILDGFACLKPGRTKRPLTTRIPEYINTKKRTKNQKFKSCTLKLLCVVKFRTEEDLKSFESLIKKFFRNAPLRSDQHGSTEQYKIEAWYRICYQLDNPITSIKSYVATNHLEYVDELVKWQHVMMRIKQKQQNQNMFLTRMKQKQQNQNMFLTKW